jgi:hypothetical protein
MKQHVSPPSSGLVLEVGSGDHPNPRSDVLVDRFLTENIERGGDLVVDGRPLVVADAHHLPFRNGSFAYVIASHILEHMDDPRQFADELTRVGSAGYIGCPTEIAERLFHWSFHRWYVNRVGSRLVLYPKEPAEPLGELFDYLYAYNPAYLCFQRSMPHLFWIDYEWQGSIDLELTTGSPLPLRDPQQLHDLVRPRFSLPRLLVLLLAAWLMRWIRLARPDTR